MTCSKWGVMTTIFEPSEAVRRLNYMNDWCVVIVGRSKYSVHRHVLCHCNKYYLQETMTRRWNTGSKAHWDRT